MGNCRIVGHGEQLLVGLGCRSITALIAVVALLLQDGLFEKEFKRAYVGDGGAGGPMPSCPELLSSSTCLPGRFASDKRPCLGGIASNDINKRDAYTNTIQTERLREKVKTELR